MRIASLALLLAGCAGADGPRLAEIPERYPSYGRVDEVQREAPAACADSVQAPTPRISASRDPGTHGRKLYYLYARNHEAYRMVRELSQPVGQVLVKESWVPGKPLTRGPLFVMMKTGEADSDSGWN